MRYPWGLKFWDSGEWQVCQELLDDLKEKGNVINPDRVNMFRSLSSVGGVSSVKAVLVGQDPYPESKMATGLAFSIPREIESKSFPPTLKEILGEYSRDLGYPLPTHGDLSEWTKRGVLLWNVIPSCTANASMSHDWDEYSYLNRELFSRLSEKGVVFALLGGVARRYEKDVSAPNNRVIYTSHPSPRGSLNSRAPFRGSRLFSTINDKLREIGLEPIDWRLSDGVDPSSIQRTNLGGGRILDNIQGTSIPGILSTKLKPNTYVSNFEV